MGQGWEDSSAADCLQKVLQAQSGAVSSVCAVHASRWAGGPPSKPQVLHLWNGAISGLSTRCASASLLACANGPGEVGRARESGEIWPVPEHLGMHRRELQKSLEMGSQVLRLKPGPETGRIFWALR